jgi:predicted TIM-barrel fold metal-dependent hydrolase
LLRQSYRPESKLVTRATAVERPRFAVVDAHNHLSEPFGGGWDKRPLTQLLDRLDAAGVSEYVDLDGGWGEDIMKRPLDLFNARAPARFYVFGGVDCSQWKVRGPGFPEWAADRIFAQQRAGAEGLKIWKSFGLHVQHERDRLLAIDDPRLDPLWQAAGEAALPVLIHVADPVAFFEPQDERNERWEELQAHPDWAFPNPPYPTFISILEGLRALVVSHPSTTFIGAHVGCYAEDLAWVGGMLDECSNYYVDISARWAELGRQPYAARRFMIDYQDRVLFGLDLGPDLDSYRLAYRFLESEDEYFSYSTEDPPPQGRWRIYGLHLPDQALQMIYAGNARRILSLGKSR